MQRLRDAAHSNILAIIISFLSTKSLLQVVGVDTVKAQIKKHIALILNQQVTTNGILHYIHI